MAELINAYKPSCCNKAYMTKASAVRHEKSCPKNINNRACATCEYKEEGTETYYNPYHNGNPGSTDYDYKYWYCKVYKMQLDQFSIDVDGMTMRPKMNCEFWKRRTNNE